jgi:membrane peptidoglycan carboxypeptidase
MQAVENELTNLDGPYHYSQKEIDSGGLHIVTTISEPMMNELYASVAYNEKLMAEDGKAMPWYAHVGAVLEQPGTGQIWAMYSGPSFSEPASQCDKIYCQLDMALQNREQVGSSFKPYVLALARSQGMDVETSKLDGDSPLWIPPVAEPDTYSSQAQPADSSEWYEVANDAGDGSLGPVSVVTASAMSLNTAYTDLYHRVAGTNGQNIIQIAQAFGVNTGSASGLAAGVGGVGTALGTASLTVEEQANTFATFADNGEYTTPHIVGQITQGAAVTSAKVVHRQVLTADEASDVDYALSFDDKPGGTAPTAGLSDGREIVAKTGTTDLAQSAFFIGTIPQFTLAVGMFTNEQSCPKTLKAGCAVSVTNGEAPPAGLQTLYGVGGLQGYGGQWPASIWRTFAENEFTKLTPQSFPTPDFGGTAWDMLQAQPTATPSPTPTASQGNGNGNGNGGNGNGGNGNGNGGNGGNGNGNGGNGGGGNGGGGGGFALPAATPAETNAAAVTPSSGG